MNEPSEENTDKQTMETQRNCSSPSQNPIKSFPPRGKENQHIFTAVGWGCQGLHKT